MNTLLTNLERALSVKRDHGSESEAEFVSWLCDKVSPNMIDAAGNLHVMIGTSETMFTAHTDTVHTGGGPNLIRKDANGRDWHASGAPLGADCGAGVALMLHMIDAQIPGRYVFFRGEECGGIGSEWLASNMPSLVTMYVRCVSFDRAGYSDVITHQGMGRCCSDLFANSLANALNDVGMLYMPSDNGVFTDSANFTKLIPECTNLSVGYFAQHSSKENQNVEFLQQLADALVKIDWENLPVARNPAERDFDDTLFGYSKYAPLRQYPTYNEDWLEALQNGDVELVTEMLDFDLRGSLKMLFKSFFITDINNDEMSQTYVKGINLLVDGDIDALDKFASTITQITILAECICYFTTWGSVEFSEAV